MNRQMAKQAKTKKSVAELSSKFRPLVKDVKQAGQKAPQVVSLLMSEHPDAKCALHYENPLQLLIATMLSAQCTDERVNIVTKALFKAYHSAADYGESPVEEIEALVKSTGFFRNKAKNIKKCCMVIVSDHQGEVPETLVELNALAGVGRKTANVVLGNAFNIASVVCDTHVIRLCRLIGLSRNIDATKLEFDLMKIFPQDVWTKMNHVMIEHGRKICVARRPKCELCCIKSVCCYGIKHG
jgi:endonuclease-3